MHGGSEIGLLATCDGNVRVYGEDEDAITVPSHAVYGGGAEAKTVRWYPNGRLLVAGIRGL